jgi:hypothetical protein
MKITENELDFSHVNDKISHLTKAEIVELINKYYAGEKVTRLIKDYKVKVPTSRFIFTFPKKLTDTHCFYCRTKMVQD